MMFDRELSLLDFSSIAIREEMASSSKCARVDLDSTKFLIYIIPHKIQKRRLDILNMKSREKGLPITDIFWYVSSNSD